jgi:dUTP pyrophosphatase
MAKYNNATRYINFLKVTDQGGEPRTPDKKYSGDAGWDLFVSRPCIIEPGETKEIHTDIRVNIPPFYFMRIVGRSSTLKLRHLVVSEGIIDNDYTGELFISVHNIGDEPFEAKPGMRLAQAILHKIEDIRWAEVDPEYFEDRKRGTRGFGSTGLYEISRGPNSRPEYSDYTRGMEDDPQKKRRKIGERKRDNEE